MRLRVLTAAAIAAWSKTAAATSASVLPGTLDQPAGASVTSATSQVTSCPSGPVWGPLFHQNSTNSVSLGGSLAFKGLNCRPGTASLQASLDQTQWKSIDTQHATTEPSITLTAPCLAGTWWYRGFYVTDDHTFKGASLVAQFTC